MKLLIILILTELLVPVVLRQHFSSISREKYLISIIIHTTLSLWLWILYFEIHSDKGFYDAPRHIWLLMNMTGMITAVVVPRVILIILHFAGRITRMKYGGQRRWLTNTGLTFMVFILLIIGFATLYGRFNFTKEYIPIKIEGLNKDLEGFKIIHISDLHLAGFYHHSNRLQDVIKEVNSLNPDMILNTGDFISYGWREFDKNDTILSLAKSRYGNFAVMGNHDFGTYHPFYTEADRDNNVLIMNQLIKSSGYKVLNDEFTVIDVGNARIALIGIITMGRFPDILYGDLDKAISAIDSVDLKILLSHDPNFWEKKVTGKTDIDITLSGHTHGMQMGIITEKIRWSPAKYFYPHWNGLFTKGNQSLYVNRGLGVLAIPFRIWMPPEITVITLESE